MAYGVIMEQAQSDTPSDSIKVFACPFCGSIRLMAMVNEHGQVNVTGAISGATGPPDRHKP